MAVMMPWPRTCSGGCGPLYQHYRQSAVTFPMGLVLLRTQPQQNQTQISEPSFA